MRHSFVRSLTHRASTLAAAALVAASVTVRPAAAQSYTSRDRAVAAGETASTSSGYHVAVGERSQYDVEYKGRGVGTATLEVLGRETMNGFSTYHAALTLSAGWLFAKVNDKMESWFDTRRYFSRRFVQDQRELTHERKRNYEIAPEQGIFVETYSGDIDSLATNEPLDDISFLYYVRTLPLTVGEVDTIPRYFKAGRDVIVKVLRKETITVPAGTFRTIVVQPTITNAGGLFGQGGKAEVYLSDDQQRTVVMLKSNVPVLGSLSLTLRSNKQ